MAETSRRRQGGSIAPSAVGIAARARPVPAWWKRSRLFNHAEINLSTAGSWIFSSVLLGPLCSGWKFSVRLRARLLHQEAEKAAAALSLQTLLFKVLATIPSGKREQVNDDFRAQEGNSG